MSTTKSTMPRIRRTVSPGYRPSVTLLVRPMNPPARQGEQAEEVDLKAGPYRSVVSANAERYTASDEEASHFGAEGAGVYFLGGLESSGGLASSRGFGGSPSGSCTCQMFLSGSRPKTPTWFDSVEPIWPIQMTRKGALRQRRRTSMVWPRVVRKPTPSKRAPSLLRLTV